MNHSALPYWLALAVILAAMYGGYKVYQVNEARRGGGVMAVNLPPLEDFELTDHHGRPFRSADMKGRVWVASFFFTTCPANCARLNTNIKYLTEREDLQDVTWISITVDPETDTEAKLRDYAESLNAVDQWLFCRHDKFSYVKRLAEDVLTIGGVSYKGHNDYVVVIDRRGEIAGLFDGYNLDDLSKGVALLQRCLADEASDDDQKTPARGDSPASDSPSAEAA